MMKTSKIPLILLFCVSLHYAGRGQSVLALVESTGVGCGVISDCGMNTICFDIILTPGVTAVVQSYNIWLQYQETGLAYLSDDACIADNGTDNNLDALQFYRVAGITGDQQVMAGVPIILHNICFTYDNLSLLDGSIIYVGGTVFGTLFSTLTYNMPPSNEPMLFPPVPLVMTAGTISCLELLPLKLLSFQAAKEGETSVLNWTAIHEKDSRFEIERSTDADGFEMVGMVAAEGTIGSTAHHSFTDPFPVKGINYYRLRFIAANGNVEYSPIESVTFGESGHFVRIWPNPIGDDLLNVRIRNDEEMQTEIRLINISGAEVLSQKEHDLEIQKQLDLHFLPSGVYTLVVESAAKRYIEKIVILK